MEREDKLINKIKKGLIKSGFPLEMKVSKILKNNGWNHSMCNYYLDFESNVYREYDIHAEKRINGIDVMLFIECKKSDDKQVILYSPQNNKFLPFIDIYFKAFPKMPNNKEYIPDQKKQKDAFVELRFLITSTSYLLVLYLVKERKLNKTTHLFSVLLMDLLNSQ